MPKANRKFKMRDDRDAVIGVDALIVFIAIILVAAIAAGVIIKTAYMLKDQAERTANAAKNEATGGPKVIDNTGDRGNPLAAGGDIAYIKFTITTWEGSDAIDIGNLRLHWVGPTKEVYLTLRPTPNEITPDPTHFGADEIPANTAGNGWDLATDRYYLDDNNVIYLRIDLTNPGVGGNGINDPLGPNEKAVVTFIPAHGPPVTEEFITPADYGSAQYIDLTNT